MHSVFCYELKWSFYAECHEWSVKSSRNHYSWQESFIYCFLCLFCIKQWVVHESKQKSYYWEDFISTLNTSLTFLLPQNPFFCFLERTGQYCHKHAMWFSVGTKPYTARIPYLFGKQTPGLPLSVLRDRGGNSPPLPRDLGLLHTHKPKTNMYTWNVGNGSSFYSHQILAQQEITNKKKVNERKQKSEIQRNRWVSNDCLRIRGENRQGAQPASKQNHMCFKQQL